MSMLRIEGTLRRQIVEAGRSMDAKGMIAATDGNISARLDDDLILVTPSGLSKGELKESDLVVCDLSGKRVRGHRKPTSELGMHLLIYRARPDVEAVTHAHPPVSTGFACAGIPLVDALVSEVILSVGCVPMAPYATTGTPEMEASLKDLVPRHDAILLANHGVVTSGRTLKEAYWRLETVEQFAKVSLVARLLGRQNLLGEAEVGKLLKARQAYFGLEGTPERVPGCPRAA